MQSRCFPRRRPEQEVALSHPRGCPEDALPDSCLLLGRHHPVHPTFGVDPQLLPPLQKHCHCWGGKKWKSKFMTGH